MDEKYKFKKHRKLGEENSNKIDRVVHIIENYIDNLQTDFDEGRIMTNHGFTHINIVLDNAHSIVQMNPFTLDENDWFYLYLAILIHDIAANNYGYSRATHAKDVKDAIENKLLPHNESLMFIDEAEWDRITTIAAAHGGDAKDEYLAIHNNDVYSTSDPDNPKVLLLAIILRIADALDITQKRTKEVPFSSKSSVMNEQSQHHWAKHESIPKWQFSEQNRSVIIIFMKPKMLAKIDSTYKKLTKDSYIDFMKCTFESIIKELKDACTASKDYVSENTFRFEIITLKPHGENNPDDYGGKSYIDGLNSYLQYQENPIANVEQDISDDHNRTVKREVEQKKTPTPKMSRKNAKEYYVIGSDSTRKMLDQHVRENGMLRLGCYEHKDIKLLDWLDTFNFHQDRSLLQESSNAISRAIEQKEVNLIIGIGLKGARIAGIVGLTTEIPVLFFVDETLGTELLEKNNNYQVAIITDCVLSGENSYNCICQLLKTCKNVRIVGVYSVFLRNPLIGKKQNKLLSNDIDLFVINDHYPYKECKIGEAKCPLYSVYGKAIYDKEYKRKYIEQGQNHSSIILQYLNNN
jgi:hypothetical protein